MSQSQQARMDPDLELPLEDTSTMDVDSGPVLDNTEALEVLESDLGADEDPERVVRGIRNGVLLGLALWIIGLAVFGLVL